MQLRGTQLFVGAAFERDAEKRVIQVQAHVRPTTIPSCRHGPPNCCPRRSGRRGRSGRSRNGRSDGRAQTRAATSPAAAKPVLFRIEGRDFAFGAVENDSGRLLRRSHELPVEQITARVVSNGELGLHSQTVAVQFLALGLLHKPDGGTPRGARAGTLCGDNRGRSRGGRSAQARKQREIAAKPASLDRGGRLPHPSLTLLHFEPAAWRRYRSRSTGSLIFRVLVPPAFGPDEHIGVLRRSGNGIGFVSR